MTINFKLIFPSPSQKLRHEIADAMATSISASMPTSSAQMTPAATMGASSINLFGTRADVALTSSLMDSCQSFSQPEVTLTKSLIDSSLRLSSSDLLGPQTEVTLAPSLMDSCQSFSQPEDALAKPLMDSSLSLTSLKMPIEWYFVGPHDYLEASSAQSQLKAKIQPDIQDCFLESLSSSSLCDGSSPISSSVDSVESQLRKLVIHAGD
ncbi:hypothetical protein BGZ51_002566, partial [Haplosporangium sp. Z 767]